MNQAGREFNDALLPKNRRRCHPWMKTPIHSGILTLPEFQRNGIDAEPLPRGRRTVIEDVAKVAAALFAEYFGPDHPQFPVFALPDVIRRPREARPSGPGLELVIGFEKLGAARCAEISAFLLVVQELSAEGRFCALHPHHDILLRAQLLPEIDFPHGCLLIGKEYRRSWNSR